MTRDAADVEPQSSDLGGVEDGQVPDGTSPSSNVESAVPTEANTDASSQAEFPRLPQIARPDMTYNHVEPDVSLPRIYARRTATANAAHAKVVDRHHPLRLELDEVFAMIFSATHSREPPSKWGTRGLKGTIHFKNEGLFSGPYPRCCEVFFTLPRGHPKGETCKLNHEWFKKEELVYMVSNPDKTEADRTKRWLTRTLETWIANNDECHGSSVADG